MAKPDERFKIYEEVFDNSTIMTLYQLRSRHYFDDFEGTISTGKEANVFRAKKGRRYLAIKIYRTQTSDFKNMWKYIVDDPRFLGISRKKRDIVFAWARKEYKNLMICRNAGVRVPKPIVQRDNVLIMQFIGKRGVAAQTADKQPPANPKVWYKIIIGYIKKLYKEGIVHGDISKYNIMNLDEEPVLIDISQGVKLEHPLSMEMLRRDITNINRWFKSMGVKTKADDDILGSLK
jgi:RIO kinase 1